MIWRFPKSWGYPHGWMMLDGFVNGKISHNLEGWMMTGGNPMTKRKPPFFCDVILDDIHPKAS